MQKINIFKMQQINSMNNLKTWFNDFNNQKTFLKSLNYLIFKYISFKTMQSELSNMNYHMPNIMNELGLPFCDLMCHYGNILNNYIIMYKVTKEDTIKNILITLINAFNFKSSNKTPADMIIEELKNYDKEIGKIAYEKRAEKNEIEEIYDALNIQDLNDDYIKQLKEKINEIEKRNIYPIYTIKYLEEKLDLIEKNIQNKNIYNLMFNINNISNILKNNIQNFNYFFNNIHSNNNTNNNKNALNADELNKIKETPLKERKYLYKDEDLNDEEDEYTEFKLYSYPFNQEKIDELKRQYCGFLNSHGGRIYIGINDLKTVKGLYLDNKQRDTIKKELLDYACDFYPKCRNNAIAVSFIQIKDMKTQKIINCRYVIKIIVMPGEPHELYSLNNKDGFISTLRLPGQCINLTAEEIYTEILKRGGLLKRSNTDEQNEKGDIKENEDDNKENTSEELDESIFESGDEKTGEETENTDKKMKVIYVVEISNIDTSLEVKRINGFFNGCGSAEQKFPAKNGKSIGFGEMTFSKKDTAKRVIKEFNGSKICGAKKIIMRLRKRIKQT